MCDSVLLGVYVCITINKLDNLKVSDNSSTLTIVTYLMSCIIQILRSTPSSFWIIPATFLSLRVLSARAISGSIGFDVTSLADPGPIGNEYKK